MRNYFLTKLENFIGLSNISQTNVSRKSSLRLSSDKGLLLLHPPLEVQEISYCRRQPVHLLAKAMAAASGQSEEGKGAEGIGQPHGMRYMNRLVVHGRMRGKGCRASWRRNVEDAGANPSYSARGFYTGCLFPSPRANSALILLSDCGVMNR